MDKIRLHLLFVDDEEDLQMVFEFNFREEMDDDLVRLSFSTSGEQCLELLKTEDGADVILVLSDINMPKMDGLTLLDKIKEQFPHIEVYMVSAYGNDDFISRAKDKGASHFFTKPVDFTMLKNVISSQFGVNLYSA